MREITLLDQNTIDKIAAGEVVERPASVVKELVENAIDAQATAVTVEIRDGGIALIRVTDNGVGIPADQVPVAFLRHATSKIRAAEDLSFVASLGFRGEALSSIAAVARVELITKTREALTGIRYRIEGGIERGIEEIGAPNGTTFLARDLFFNTPARAKFLRSVATETNHVIQVVEALALANPGCSVKLIANGATRVFTSGNGATQELIHSLFGRDTSAHLIPVSGGDDAISVEGYIGAPEIARGNRSAEHYFINGRYVRHKTIASAIEEGYRGRLMQHRYPFVLLYLNVDPTRVDVNVHPTKMEVRISDETELRTHITEAIRAAFRENERIPEITLGTEVPRKRADDVKPRPARSPEPFEDRRRAEEVRQRRETDRVVREASAPYAAETKQEAGAQQSLFTPEMLSEAARSRHRLIGQVFRTYWLIEYEDALYIVDQHAAHEKVLYEQLMQNYRARTIRTQIVSPATVVTLAQSESDLLAAHTNDFTALGFELEPFGGTSWRITGIPSDLPHISEQNLFMELLGTLSERGAKTSEQFLDRVATMACKAAVKGNQEMNAAEADALIDALLHLEDPYHCPHGRPTITTMTHRELDRKFRRIL